MGTAQLHSCGSLVAQRASPGHTGPLPPSIAARLPCGEALAAAPPVIHLCRRVGGWTLHPHSELHVRLVPPIRVIRLPQAVASRGDGQGCRDPEALGLPGPGPPVLCCPAWGLRPLTVRPCWLRVAPAQADLGWDAHPGACELSLWLGAVWPCLTCAWSTSLTQQALWSPCTSVPPPSEMDCSQAPWDFRGETPPRGWLG